MSKARAKVFFGMPCYTSWMHRDGYRAILRASEGDCEVYTFMSSSSLLGMTFNMCWVEALRAYLKGEATHFAMMHSDIVPEGPFLDIMLEQMEMHHAQVISAVVAIKNGQHETSTAISQIDNPWEADRLSLEQLEEMPLTFSIDDLRLRPRQLLVNTGLMLVELGEWALRTNDAGELKTYFTIRDQVVRLSERKFKVSAMPEDWNFSRMADEQGCKVCATQAIRIDHIGEAAFRTGRPKDIVRPIRTEQAEEPQWVGAT